MESQSRWILIIDDDAKLRFTLSVILKRAGYSVVGVENGGQALHQLRIHPFHLLFLDICLPDLDGLQMLTQIHRLFPNMPVIILSGDDSVETTLKAMHLGACGYLLKPINPCQILTCIDQVLSRAQRPMTTRKINRSRRRTLTP